MYIEAVTYNSLINSQTWTMMNRWTDHTSDQCKCGCCRARASDTQGHCTMYMAIESLHDLHIQGHEVDPQHLSIDFRTLWPKRHGYQHQDYPSRIFLAKNITKRQQKERNLGNCYRKNYRGCKNPLGCRRVKILQIHVFKTLMCYTL